MCVFAFLGLSAEILLGISYGRSEGSTLLDGYPVRGIGFPGTEA